MKKVLVVEADKDLLHAIVEVLRSEGYECVAVETGARAIGYLQGNELPCMVLLDLVVRGSDGVAFIRWVSSQQKLRDLPIAVMSTQPRQHQPDLSRFRHHIVQVLRKPFGIDAVLKILEEHCGAPDGESGEPKSAA